MNNKKNKKNNINIHSNEDDSMLETVSAVLSSAARVYASFPAGDYHLNSEQNMAINSLIDSVYALKNKNDEYKKAVDEYHRDYSKWQLKELRNRGIITEQQYNESLKEKGL